MQPLPVHLARSWLSWLFHSTPKPWTATLIENAPFVCLQYTDDTDPFQAGLFGKGSLSRSLPTWKSRVLDTPDKGTVFLEHITEDRRKQKRNQDNATSSSSPSAGLWSTEEIKAMVDHHDYEQVVLDFYEAFFLIYALNTLAIYNASNSRLSIDDCWTIFSKRTPLFATRYAAYHYYRSLGWAPKQGTKFGVDFVLYRTGRKHHHADFAVVVIPAPEGSRTMDWEELHRLNRVCTQVKKTLVLCYVTKPEHTHHPRCLESFKIQEVILKRWSPERNREK